MTPRRAAYFAGTAIAVALLVVLGFLPGIQPYHSPRPVTKDDSRVIAIESKKPTVADSSRGQPAIFGPAKQLREEFREATDLKAVFDKYRGLPDPTGEISFVLGRLVSECEDFTGRSFEAQLAYTDRTVPARNPDHPRRAAELSRRIARCKGFEALDPRGRDYLAHAFQAVTGGLFNKSADAAYPAAVARKLQLGRGNTDVGQSDKVAIGLLSGTIDSDVLEGVGGYLGRRNAQNESSEQRAVRSFAWTLLQCEFGDGCGADNRLIYMPCVFEGACNLSSVEDALRRNGATTETLSAAYALRTRIYDAIRNQDWAALGFTPQEKRP